MVQRLRVGKVLGGIEGLHRKEEGAEADRRSGEAPRQKGIDADLEEIVRRGSSLDEGASGRSRG